MSVLLEYKCPACGGALNFDSNEQNMKCPYCDTEFEVAALKEMDEELRQQPQEDMSWQEQPQAQWEEGEQENLRTYICNSCGGEIIADDTTAATKCPYCDNPIVMSGQFAGKLRPDLVIPFKLDKNAAMEKLKEHLRRKPLLPKLFRTENRIQQVQGLYVPFWLFDSNADADIQYKATRVRHWSDSNYNYTRTSHYGVYRAGGLSFEAVPVDGSSKMADDLMESIEPYDLSQGVDFQTAYLAGYLADTYDIAWENSIQRANERIKTSTEQAFANTVVGYASVIPVSSSVRLKDSKVRYALYPVWVLTTKYKEKIYTFAMNGQTGKFVGNLPIDWRAFALWLGGITIGGGIVSFLLGLLFGMV